MPLPWAPSVWWRINGNIKIRLCANPAAPGQQPGVCWPGGMANALTGLFSGFPVAGSFSRAAINFRAGAKTRVAALLASLLVLVAMQFLGPFARYLPRSALSGVLIVTAVRYD